MSISKNPRVDLKRKRQRVLETGIIISLTFLILAFKYVPEIESQIVFKEKTQGVLIGDDSIPTEQKPEVPPPPDPVKIVFKDLEGDMEDIPLDDTEIDFSKELSAPPPIQDEETEEEEEFREFIAVEKMPSPIGGIGAIQSKIVYPEIAVRAGIEGRVYVNAYVDKKGNVYKTVILKGIGGGCDEEAARAIRNTKFNPGKQRGKAVRVIVSVPVTFKLR